MNFNLKERRQRKRAIEEVITLKVFDENGKKNTQSQAICNKKSEAKPSGVTLRVLQDMGGGGEREKKGKKATLQVAKGEAK